VLERIAAAHDYSEVAPGLRGAGREVRSATPGGWRRNLSRTERKAMHEILGAELAAFGYLDAGRAAA
jgi:hypothetical protein